MSASRPRPLRIRTAIFGVYVAASALGFAVMVGVVLRDVRLRYVESMRRTLGDTAQFLGAFVAGSGGPGGEWTARLAALPPQAHLLRVFACDADGRVTYDSASGRDVGATYGWMLRPAGDGSGVDEPTRSNAAAATAELCVAAEVRQDGRLLGWVGVGRPLASVVDAIRQARWRLGAWLVALALVMTAAGWWIASKLTHSLERLTEYALAVRDGRSATPPQSRAREVAALGRAFEEMRVALEGKAYVERYTQALAHEFKAPLSSIRGAAELLAENPPEEDRRRFLGNLRAEADRLQQIVERLFELAALESRRPASVLGAVDLAAIAREVLDAQQGLASARAVRCELRVSGPVPVKGEAFLLGQGVGNLVQNAIEFTPAGGDVTVTVSTAGGRANVTVDDTGPGVPDFALARVFERFYSLPRPDTGRKSSGLGLSIVREIGRLHGGEVVLENRPGGGARATFWLPCAESG